MAALGGLHAALAQCGFAVPAEPKARAIARALYAGVKDLPLVSPARPHRAALVCRERAVPRSGATADRARPLRVPHALFSQGVRLEELGVPRSDGSAGRDRRAEDLAAVRRALLSVPRHADAACGSTTRSQTLFGIDEPLTPANADAIYDTHRRAAADADEFRPRALFERFNLEVIATTDSAARRSQVAQDDPRQRLDGPGGHRPTGPDAVVDPDSATLPANLDTLGEITGEDTGSWQRLSRRAPQAPGLLQGDAARRRRDHGHPTARDRRPRRRRGRGALRQGAHAARPTPASASCSARRC